MRRGRPTVAGSNSGRRGRRRCSRSSRCARTRRSARRRCSTRSGARPVPPAPPSLCTRICIGCAARFSPTRRSGIGMVCSAPSMAATRCPCRRWHWMSGPSRATSRGPPGRARGARSGRRGTCWTRRCGVGAVSRLPGCPARCSTSNGAGCRSGGCRSARIGWSWRCGWAGIGRSSRNCRPWSVRTRCMSSSSSCSCSPCTAAAGAGDGEPEIGQSDIGQPLGLGSLAVGGAATPVLAAPVHTPAQLPRDIADFTGREAESASLAGLLAAGGGAYVPVGVSAGRPGVGKTALAVHVAHQVRAEFPDGQLYLDLHGGSVSPTSPASALEYLLRSVGLSLAELPESFQQRAALFRTWLAGQRILIVADDARDEEHVRALLPGSPGCAVLITSRTPLVGIDGARHLHLQSFDPADGLRMLRNVVGAERVDAEPAPAADIVAACAGLPLAVHIAAGKLTARPHWSLRHLAALLADESRRLDELVCADRAVRRSIALTADLLTPAQREAFMTLSLAELPTFDVAAAAAILGTTHTQAAELVDALVEGHLVDVAGWSPTDEFQVRFHDLVRLYAREQAAAHLDPQVGRAALTRLLDRYLALATIADAALPLSTDSYLAAAPSRVAQCEPALFRWLASNADAWFEAESTNLTSPVHQAARTGLDSYTWRIMNKTASFTMLHSRRELWTGAGPVAVDCARRTGDRLGEGITLLAIGKLESERTEGRQGGTELEAALRVFRDIGDDRGQARALKDLALRASLNGDTQAGTDLVAEALRIAEGLGDEVATADALGIQSSLRLAAGDSAGALQSALRAQRL